MQSMTFEQMQHSDADFLLCKDVCDLLRCKQDSLNAQAKEDPSKLGFPVCVMGTRVRIPRLAFIHWVQYGNAPIME